MSPRRSTTAGANRRAPGTRAPAPLRALLLLLVLCVGVGARETAPAAATPLLFQDASGKPLAFLEAVIGGRSVGTPGVPRLLETVHRRFGRLPWASLFQPAIDLSERGFAVSPRLASLIKDD